MSSKRKIKASEIVQDLRDGMTNDDLTEKYGILSDQLTVVFGKLIDARVMTHTELAFRFPSSRMTVSDVQIRQSSRSYPPVMLRIYDLDDLNSELGAKDLSEKGVHVVGMQAEVGQKVSFLIQAISFEDVDPFTFDAECRWTRTESSPNGDPIFHSGFEITEIDEAGQEQIHKIMAKFPTREE